MLFHFRNTRLSPKVSGLSR